MRSLILPLPLLFWTALGLAKPIPAKIDAAAEKTTTPAKKEAEKTPAEKATIEDVKLKSTAELRSNWPLTENGQSRPRFATSTFEPHAQSSYYQAMFSYGSLDAKAKDSSIHNKGHSEFYHLHAKQIIDHKWRAQVSADRFIGRIEGQPLGRERIEHSRFAVGLASASTKHFVLGVDFAIFGMERAYSDLSDARSHRSQGWEGVPSISYTEGDTFVTTAFGQAYRREEDGIITGRSGYIVTQWSQRIAKRHHARAEVTYWLARHLNKEDKNYLSLEFGDSWWLNSSEQISAFYFWRQAQSQNLDQALPLQLGQERLSLGVQTFRQHPVQLGFLLAVPFSLLQRQVAHHSIELSVQIAKEL